MRGLAASIVLSVVAAAACGLGPPAALVPSSSCGNMPGGACDEQVRLAAAGLTGIDSVDIECDVPGSCTRAHGTGTSEVRFKNGEKLDRRWSYVGDAGPAPAITCTGIAQGQCRVEVDDQVDQVAPSKHVVAVTVICTSATCTEAAGSVAVHIVLGDGTSEDHGAEWSGGVAPSSP